VTKKAASLIPKTWAWSTIGTVVQERVEQSGPRRADSFLYVDISSIDTSSKRIIAPKTIRTSEAPSRARQRIMPHDVLVSMTRPNLNAVAIVPEDFEDSIGTTGFDVLRTRFVEPRWLFYVVQTSAFVESMSMLVQGALYPAIRPKDIRAYRIPIAPFPEQLRIVEEIEKQFTRLDAAVAALKRVQTNLKRYRAAVLKAVCEGRLVPTEAELARRESRSYEPASILLKRILVERRTSWEADWLGEGGDPSGLSGKWKYDEPFIVGTSGLPDLPEGWCWASLDSLLREPLRNGHSAKTIAGADGIPTLSLSAVTYGDFSASNIKNTSADPRKVDDLWVEPGDIFIERSNTPELVGTARLYSGEPHVAIFPDLLIRVRLLSGVVPAYIEAVLQSHRTRQFYRRRAQGISGTMPKINQNTVQETMIPLPPLAEQELIVEALTDQVSVIEHLEKELQDKLGKAEALRQSTLKSAFLGKLVPQDPSDEPASILLGRMSSKSSSGILAPAHGPRRKGEVLSMSRSKEKRRMSIVEALRSTQSGMSPEALLSATGHEADSIDEFYAELKTQVESGSVEEIRSDDKIVIRSLQK
jgi:type I restriction enzyme S subunit